MSLSSPSPSRPIIGWDLGGVHVKAALVRDGAVREVVQAPCSLWQGTAALEETLAALPDWCRSSADHAVTMTGELTDCFADRREGVRELSRWAARALGGSVRIYAGRSGFIASERAENVAAEVASANWHATASLVGRNLADTLLVDVGSTTADLIPIADGRPVALGYSDAERLETGELVYTGLVRTPVLALASRAPFRGRLVGLMAETFATAADVYRLLGELPEGADQHDAADGRGKSIGETETRLARMIGRDRQDGDAEAWRRLAAFFADRQLTKLYGAATQVLSQGSLPPSVPLVGCGVGRHLGARLAGRLGLPYRDLSALIAPGQPAAEWLSWCAPAVAVALLAATSS